MFYRVILKFLVTATSLTYASCSIDGSFNPSSLNYTRPGEDPCNPLYWYPRDIPEYCFYKTTQRPKPFKRPIPMPIPIPIPPPLYPQPMFPAPMMPVIPPRAQPVPIMAPPIPLPFGVPLVPTNPMIPVAGIQVNPPVPPDYPAPPEYSVRPTNPAPPPYPPPVYSHPEYSPPAYPPPAYPPPAYPPPAYPHPAYPLPPQYPLPNHIGMVPGLQGMVSPDGGINILPFSDVYADILERHKQKMIRRRLQKFLDEYDRYPWKGKKIQ